MQRTETLSDDQVEFFNENGYLVIENFADDLSQLTEMKEEISKLIRENFDIHKHRSVFVSSNEEHIQDVYFLESADKISYFIEKEKDGAKSNSDGRFIMNKVGHALHENEVFKKFSFSPKIYQIAKQVAGFQQPTIVQSMYIFKPPFIGGEVSAHRDNSFILTRNKPNLGLWFPMEDATIKNGCLWGVPGSHKWGLATRWERSCLDNQKNKMEFVDLISDQKEREEYKKRDEEAQYVPIEMKAGSVILLHGHFLHKSYKNDSDKSREAYTLHLVDLPDYDEEKNWLLRYDGYPQFWNNE